MALLRRIGVIILAFLLASAVAGIVIAVALLGAEFQASDNFTLPPGFWILVLLTAGFSGAAAIVPLFLLVVLAETFRLRRLLLYAIVCAVVIPLIYRWSEFGERLEPGTVHFPMLQETAIAAAAGVVLGFVYWLLAGRKAGVWRDRPS